MSDEGVTKEHDDGIKEAAEIVTDAKMEQNGKSHENCPHHLSRPSFLPSNYRRTPLDLLTE